MKPEDKRVLALVKNLSKLAQKNNISSIKIDNLGHIEFFKTEPKEVQIAAPMEKDDPRAKMPSDEEMLFHSTAVRFEEAPEVE